ncbi:MAG TPA: hypothetical protein DCS93_06095 [Microscillaceae bacterium]|nr:hypothetical protein [Microscillaceae bacterium]
MKIFDQKNNSQTQALSQKSTVQAKRNPKPKLADRASVQQNRQVPFYNEGWGNEGQRAYNPEGEVIQAKKVDPKGLEKEPTYLEMWKKVSANETFMEEFGDFLSGGKYADHPINLELEAMGKGMGGYTTHKANRMGVPIFDKDNPASIKLNNEFVPAVGGDAGKMSDLKLAGTMFHEFWHLKLSKWSQEKGRSSSNQMDHRSMIMSLKGTGKNKTVDELTPEEKKAYEAGDKSVLRRSFLEEHDMEGDYEGVLHYAEAKLKFLEQMKGSKLTELETIYHTWAGLTSTRFYHIAKENIPDLHAKMLEAQEKIDHYTGLEKKD